MAHHSGYCPIAHAFRHVGATANGQRSSTSGRSSGQGDESPWSNRYSLPKLPYLHELEASQIESRVQSRPNQLSVARHAPEGSLHTMSHELGIQECEFPLLRLPRGYTSPPIRGQLRKLPHRQGLARFAGCDSQSPEPFSAGGGARPGGMRGVSQRCCQRTIRGAIDGLLLMPSEGLPDAGY